MAFSEKDIRKGVQSILYGLAVDPADPNFEHTPDRVARALSEMCRGLHAEDEIADLLAQTFPSDYSGIVALDPFNCVGICPHHLMPVEYDAYLGYIPDGKVLGLSKIVRLTRLMSARPVLQEDLTDQIADRLQDGLGPKGVIVVLFGRHSCMRARGVLESQSVARTSAVRGGFAKGAAKDEFMRLAFGEGS